MTRFDERLDDDQTQLFAAVVRVLRADWLLHAVAVLGVMVVLSVGTAALLVTGEVASRWSALTASTRLTVLLDPQLTRVEAERLRTPIEALPQVATAIFRTREDALSRIAEAGLPAVQPRPNPLPDAWTVLLAPASTRDVEVQLTRVERLKSALAGLPGVASVQFDARWIAWIDRWAPVSRSVILWVRGIAFGVTGLACLATSFLVGRSVGAMRGATRSRLALIGFLDGAVGIVVAAVLVWAAAMASGVPLATPATGFSALAIDAGRALGALMALALTCCVLGAALGRVRQPVPIGTIVG